jgi:hypothetical protein
MTASASISIKPPSRMSTRTSVLAMPRAEYEVVLSTCQHRARLAETAQRARLASTPRYRCSTSGDARSSPGVAVTLISPFSIT